MRLRVDPSSRGTRDLIPTRRDDPFLFQGVPEIDPREGRLFSARRREIPLVPSFLGEGIKGLTSLYHFLIYVNLWRYAEVIFFEATPSRRPPPF